MKLEELNDDYLPTSTERCAAGKELIETYWDAHNSPCAHCLDEALTTVHLILAHGGVAPTAQIDIIESAQMPIDKSKAN